MRRGMTLAAATLLAALIVAALARTDGEAKKGKQLKEPTAAQLSIAKAIATGHSYEKHVVEEKLFPEVKSTNDFIELIAKVLANPTHHRDLENEREAYFDNK